MLHPCDSAGDRAPRQHLRAPVQSRAEPRVTGSSRGEQALGSSRPWGVTGELPAADVFGEENREVGTLDEVEVKCVLFQPLLQDH